MLCSLILLLLTSRIETIPIFSVQITCSAAVIKSIFFAFRLLNSIWLLQRYQDAHESKNQILLVSIFWSLYSLTMKALPTRPCANGSVSKSLLCFAIFSEAWCAWFDISFRLPLRPLHCPFPFRDSSLRDRRVFLFTLLSRWKQSFPKCPNLWQL